ncbi:hypothetical protein JDV02_007164 [Purpureocillium takamizusanense]|uniref:Major facilitator superfamily (MFS) profile domain-containing protein n=1 Tax=Purpureocillium takamizusanense TaxID=2060973 RepID=A0A9Q8QLX5_9HYPO|nr:uncharacterized protein JDV02_007164 [Purpureocillium takamizusanense]UNI21149.1 hypothetical protein JDV02_007164 [Purpureocillium takamizusanense]
MAIAEERGCRLASAAGTASTDSASKETAPSSNALLASRVVPFLSFDHGGSGVAKSEAEGIPPPMSKARRIALVATLTGAAFLNTLSSQSVVIILPSIGKSLDIPENRQQWIVSSYSLAFGCFLLLWGRVADIHGKRLVFILGSAWVTVVTAVNAFIPNEIAFSLFRALHGLGAAANVPTAIGILGVVFSPGKAKNYAFSCYAAGSPLGNVFGNIFSGLITQYSNWKWVFGVSAIMAGTTAVAGLVFIPQSPSPRSLRDQNSIGPAPIGAKPSIDWLGTFLITAGLLALMYALTEGNVVGWAVPWVPVVIVVSLGTIVLFGVWQRYLERRQSLDGSALPPLVKVSVFSNARFTAAMVATGLFFASFNTFIIFATYHFQNYEALSPLQTALRFVPLGVGGAFANLIVAQLLHRVPALFLLLCGTIAASSSSLLFAVPIPPGTSYFSYGLPAMLLSSVSADTVWPCLTLFTSQTLPREDQAIGGALINAVGQLGRALGLAISTAVQTAVMARARHVPVKDAGGMEAREPTTLSGLRAGSYMTFALGIASVVVVAVSFRNMGIIGKAQSTPARQASGHDIRDVEHAQATTS